MSSESTSRPAIGADDALLGDLTEPQRQAVTSTEGPVLVVAAAGSGKTRVITRRVAYLVQEVGIAPWQVLAITFTNKAANEMRQRVARIVTERQARALTIGTFHSVCARLLRQYADRAGLSPNFTIYDTADQKRVMKQAIEQLQFSTQNFSPANVLGTISNAKNELIDAEAYAAQAGDFYARKVAELFTRYQQILQENAAVDFDDLLLRFAQLLQRDPQARSELQQRFDYVLIDEYQDTNHAQFVIAHVLAAGHQNLCVVGDPDQSIYGWRGANIRNILDFETHYPEASVIALGQNYRSTPQILKVADALIQHNVQRKHKPLWTANDAGEPIELLTASDERHEAELVVEWLREMNEAGHRWDDMAIFYRVNALSRTLEEKLMGASIPYEIARGTAFYDRKEVKDAVAYLRVLWNPHDEVNLRRIINTPTRGIGQTTLEQVQAYAAARGIAFSPALRQAAHIPALNARAVNAIQNFVEIFGHWRQKIADADQESLGFAPGVCDVVEMIIRDSGLEAYHKSEKTGDEERLANLYELVTAAQRFDDEQAALAAEEQLEGEPPPAEHLTDQIGRFLERISLVADVDGVSESSGAVTLMTLHAAKGLEFEVVAAVGLEEGLLPHQRSLESPDQMEEERRLLFVGITRAKRRLRLHHARYRTIRGVNERTIRSQFLRQLPEQEIETINRSDEGEQDARAHSHPDLRKGAVVRHPQFGLGTVLGVAGRGHSARAKIRFNEGGVKTLVLEYARIEKVR